MLPTAVTTTLKRAYVRVAMPPIIREVHEKALTFLNPRALNDLYRRVRDAERENRKGLIIEAGCALGGSAIVLAAAKATPRPLHVYDVFGMIPPPTGEDGQDIFARYDAIVQGKAEGVHGNRYYGYEENLYEKVRENFRLAGYPVETHNIHLIQGLFEETMDIQEPVAVAHLDGDWYRSVWTCLERITPRLVRGGVLIIDDYEAWSGCRKAVDEYFADKKDQFVFVPQARLHILRR